MEPKFSVPTDPNVKKAETRLRNAEKLISEAVEFLKQSEDTTDFEQGIGTYVVLVVDQLDRIGDVIEERTGKPKLRLVR